MRAIYVFLLALFLATGAFWATMLISPPKTRAAPTAIADTWVVKKDLPPIADDYDPEF
ncbi:hypothetical protein ABEV34_18125 [Methylorubrum rhodesianum]|uniref:hypothetical protein n=1 Tax=Methylorubrum rhodesianum TaxID=29427 RepID=UPI00184EF5AB|nr:hypothetical protein [Methylorubrum rhodesianum]MBB5760543.1 hypothetical protein [Methylorubrum rhodesianum]